MPGIPAMWLFLTTVCLICGTLNAGGFLDLESEVNPEVWMNTVSQGQFQRTSNKAGLMGGGIMKGPFIAENL